MNILSLFNKKNDSPKSLTEVIAKEIIPQLKLNPTSIYLGTKEDNSHYLKNYLHSPGALFVGSMGSGKSVAAFSSIFLKSLASPNDLFFIIDPLKGATDFIPLFGRKNVIPLLNDDRYIKGVIEFCLLEIKERRNQFSQAQVSNISDWNNSQTNSLDPLANIFLVFESAHCITSSLNYSVDENNPNTTAGKLKTLSRIGRSYGIYITFINQIVNASSLPASLKTGIGNNLAFRCSSAEALFLNLPHAQDLLIEDRGKAAIDGGGFVKFLYLSSDLCKELLNLYPDTQLHSKLLGIKTNGLSELKSDPNKILQPSYYSILTMLDQAAVEEDIEFWDFITNGPKAIKP